MMTERFLVVLLVLIYTLHTYNAEETDLVHHINKRSPYIMVEELYEFNTCNRSEFVPLHRLDGISVVISPWPQARYLHNYDRNEAAKLGTCQLTVEATSKLRLSYNFYTDRTNLSSCDVKLNLYDSSTLLVSRKHLVMTGYCWVAMGKMITKLRTIDDQIRMSCHQKCTIAIYVYLCSSLEAPMATYG